MKKAFRIIIPIILAISIILCLGWYLFVYDREFTRDMFLTTARSFEANGNHQVASWLYDCAYKQAADNDDVAIELANQHIQAGNYTQAEYTLSSAIADGGGIDLYVALCKTYVEQDKLLDAVEMLDNIKNPDIKAQLDEMRPSAPTTNTESGFYNQYISVDITAENGTLYVTTNGTYPTTEIEPHTGSITLQEGENTIYAISISQEGLVSPLSIYGYTIGGVIREVTFVDASIESAVRDMLQIPDEKAVFTNDLWTITEFTVPSEATSLEDLQYFVFLESLTIVSGKENQLSSLSGLANLTKLAISETTVSDQELQGIGNLPMLKELTLSKCDLTTIAGLENAEKLTVLDLSGNTIRNISAITNMTLLEKLNLTDNTVVDLTPIAGCSNLTRLELSGNIIPTLEPIANLNNLRWLNVANNKLTDISSIASLTNLSNLSLAGNSLTDISPLAECTNLVELNLAKNALTDISILANMTQLTKLDFSNNQITELPQWPKDASLVDIDGSYNQITSLEALGGMEYLNNVYMDYNPELSSIDPLTKCHVLIQVNVYGTLVKNIRALTDMSVIVNFDPI